MRLLAIVILDLSVRVVKRIISRCPMVTRIVRFLTDLFRGISDYLHISITDRYKLRCAYCMSEHQTFLPKHDVLGIEEMDGICTLMILTGKIKTRLIGRERAVCRGFLGLVRKLSRHRNTGSLSALFFKQWHSTWGDSRLLSRLWGTPYQCQLGQT